MIPITLLCQGPSGDLDVSRGLQLTSDLKTYAAQKLHMRLSFFLGEWFLDLRLGVPYWEKVIGQKPDLGLIHTLYRRVILGTPTIAQLLALKIRQLPDRELDVQFSTLLTDGSTLTQADLDAPFITNF